MKITLMFVLFLTSTGCGTLRVNPKSCKTNAVWGTSPNSSRETTREDLEDERIIDLKAKEEFYVFYDRDLRLRDLLEAHGIKCEEVKKIRVVIKTSWFFVREVSLKVVKN